jgi:hypothetical protein
VIGVPVVVVGIGLLLLRRALVGRIDPNRSYPRPPQELPGTPPALVPAGAADAGGDVQLVPARPFAPQMEDGWLAWRFSADAFAPQCCVCLGPYERDFATPLDTSANLRVPLCAACHRTIALRWWGYTLQCIAASVAVMGLVAWLVPGPDDVGRYVIWAFGGLVLSIVTLASIPRLRVMPYRLKGYDGHRGVGWLKFDNPDYTRRLAESVRWEPAAEPAATARATQIA